MVLFSHREGDRSRQTGSMSLTHFLAQRTKDSLVRVLFFMVYILSFCVKMGLQVVT